jgi:hypothetical protein
MTRFSRAILLLASAGWLFWPPGTALAALKGWRRPTAAELAAEWRRDSPGKFAVARGDFDGDGKPDEARIMLSADGSKAAIVVALSSGGQKVIFEDPDASAVLAGMGIEALGPGKRRTACGKGAFPCAVGEPEVLSTRWDGVDYFKYGGADSVFYLPKRGGKFQRVRLSE